MSVSHKFGERSLGQGVVQLHDCGIIYHPYKPYLLCIMTRGNDFSNLEKIISSISSVTFNGIEARKNKDTNN